MIKIGLIGKTNTGKTTFFNAITMKSAEVSTYPFTTKAPNIGIGNAITLCVCKEFNVKDNPKNSACKNGWRIIPIEIIDLPGLIKGAWAGKGLGNEFLGVASQSDALLHFVDASGSIDAEGVITEPGTGDPIADYYDIEEELILWFLKNLRKNEEKIIRDLKSGKDLVSSITDALRGFKINEGHVKMALIESNLENKDFENWNQIDDRKFIEKLREISKPTLIVANKIDLPTAKENFERLRNEFPDKIIVPCSSEAELILRKAEKKGLIEYIPGEESFRILNEEMLTEKQKWALNQINLKIFGEYLRTGVQFAVNVAVFKLLRMNAVYPVYDPERLSDKDGNVLPDVFLMPPNSTVIDLAKQIHTELAKGVLYAIDARSKLRLPVNYQLRDRDVITIVSARAKK